jgi:hypothetical protein
MANLLINPGFDGEFRAWNRVEEVTVAENWLPFWVGQRTVDEVWRNQRPVYRPAFRATDASRARSGAAAQMYSTNWGTHTAGVMQVVEGISPGQHLRLRAYGHAWSTNSDTPDQSIDAGNVFLSVGIDPAAGINPFDAGVKWSPEIVNYDLYSAPLEVEAVARGDRVTVFLMSRTEWPRKHNDVFWDDVSLEPVVAISAAVASQRDVLLAIASATKEVASPVTISATADRMLNNVNLIVSGPQGTLEAVSRSAGTGGRGYIWQWEFTPQAAGPHTLTFRSDEVPAISTTVDIVPAGSTVALNSVPSALPIAGAQGRPRTQYHRVYFLLPPTAGKEWIQALLDSGTESRNRWTIGYSADDAGIGDLEKRTVIVLNPSAWPDPIIPWLRMWYPGVNIFPITAVSPADLKVILETFDPASKPERG